MNAIESKYTSDFSNVRSLLRTLGADLALAKDLDAAELLAHLENVMSEIEPLLDAATNACGPLDEAVASLAAAEVAERTALNAVELGTLAADEALQRANAVTVACAATRARRGVLPMLESAVATPLTKAAALCRRERTARENAKETTDGIAQACRRSRNPNPATVSDRRASLYWPIHEHAALAAYRKEFNEKWSQQWAKLSTADKGVNPWPYERLEELFRMRRGMFARHLSSIDNANKAIERKRAELGAIT